MLKQLPLSLSPLIPPHPKCLSLHSLIPFNANIPTLLPSHSLTITTTSGTVDTISIHNVSINSEPLYNDIS
ncbi:hypothetical protein PIB30_063728, partial [Stylosanthes scabra]|nr:hypothetical protein [Stylosanthes scabra]